MIDAAFENCLILNNLSKKYPVVEFYQLGSYEERLNDWDAEI